MPSQTKSEPSWISFLHPTYNKTKWAEADLVHVCGQDDRELDTKMTQRLNNGQSLTNHPKNAEADLVQHRTIVGSTPRCPQGLSNGQRLTNYKKGNVPRRVSFMYVDRTIVGSTQDAHVRSDIARSIRTKEMTYQPDCF